MTKKILPYILFALTLCCLAIIYDYDDILFLRPQSTHSWRQGDSNSLALNYYQHDNNIFHPHSHFLGSKNSSGNAAPSEVPFLYYFVSILYRLFGYHEWLFRITVMAIFFVGLFALFKLSYAVTQSWFYSYCAALLFFTSPVLVFYGNNFLSNIGSLSFVFVGWYFYHKFYTTKNFNWFYVAFFFFGFASTFKITALISVAGLILMEFIRFLGKKNPATNFPQLKFANFFYIGLCFSLTFAWLLYSKYYNALWQSGFFLANANPLWPISAKAIDNMWVFIKENVGDAYFFLPTLWLFVFLMAFIFYHKAKVPKQYFHILISTFAIGFAYIYLQFTHIGHDYFAIDLYIIPVFIVLISFVVLKQHMVDIYNSKLTKATIVFFLIMNVHHCDLEMKARYDGEKNPTKQLYDFQTVKHFLRDIGIKPMDTVICMPDNSPYTLTLTNQFGWTNFDIETTEQMIAKTKCGVKYILCSKNDRLTSYPKINIQYKCLANYGNICIYAVNKDETYKNTSIKEMVFHADSNQLADLLKAQSIREISESNVSAADSIHLNPVLLSDTIIQSALLTTFTMQKNCYYEVSLKLKNQNRIFIEAADSDPQNYYFGSSEKYPLNDEIDSLFLRIPYYDTESGKKIKCFIEDKGSKKISLLDLVINKIAFAVNEF